MPRASGRPVVAGLPAPARALVMGVVNVTPDSFSDGGRWFSTEDAVTHGLRLVAQGADVVDVGGESTRPGAQRVDADEELRRVVPVVAALSEAGVTVSVDTMRARVAAEALDAGARLVNDVSGGRADPDVLRVAADAAAPFVVMHWRQHSATMQQHAVYGDVVREVVEELREQVDVAVAAGVRADRVVIDPGLGFAKDAAHNWALLAHLDALHALGLPVLVAASRKRFLGQLLEVDGEPAPVHARDDATAAVSALAASAGAWCVRVHEVPASRDAVRVAARWAGGDDRG